MTDVISAKNLFKEIDTHLMKENQPSIFIEKISHPLFYEAEPFTTISKLKKVEQSKIHHPEGDVFIHTMLVVDEAAKHKHKSTNIRVFMWAALLHDIGKSVTTKIRKGKITAYDHDIEGQMMSKEFLEHFTNDNLFIEKVSYLVRYHMQILFVVKDLPFADIKGMKQHTNINDVALLGLCDRLGRLNINEEKEKNNIEIFLNKVTNL